MAALGIATGYAAGLVLLLFSHHWIVGAGGKPAPCDFLAYWVAGRAALAGNAATAYDIARLHSMQLNVAGPFRDYLYWNYPPTFFFVAVLLASVAYTPAFLAWVMSTVASYAFAIGVVARNWAGTIAACASPVIVLAAFSGQNGFFSAALFAGFLVMLPNRPIVSGILIGVMSYKPQLGVLIPIALLAGGHWRALFSAAVTAGVLAAAAALAFGSDSFASFLHSLSAISNATLALAGQGWGKIQSVYSAARFAGAGERAAWFAQALALCACAGAVFALWRRSVRYELKASALVIFALLATPYLHIYDFPVLVVAMAWLYRDRPFDRTEWAAIIFANLALFACLSRVPVGPGIVALVGCLVLRRMVRSTAARPAATAGPLPVPAQ